MALTAGLTTSFKVALLNAEMDFSSDTVQVFKCALYTSAASLGPDTTAYTATGEVANGSGYTTGGATLTISTNPTSGSGIAFMDFADPTWSSSSITARGAMIYKSGGGNPSVAIIDFGADVTTSSATFTVQIPPVGSATSIIRLI